MLRTGVGLSSILFGCLACAAPVPKDPPKIDLPKELASAFEAFEKSQDGGAEANKARAEFHKILQKAAPALPEVAPEKGEAKKYTKLTLNKEGKRVGAFRFKTPEGKANWDMIWEFVVPPASFDSWYILPREGAMASGFRTFDRGADYQEKGANLPEKNFRVIQPLTGGVLRPGTEYIIWFTFPKTDAVDFHVRVGLTEAAPPRAKD